MLTVIRDEGKYLSKLINSILNQKTKPMLWLIVNDGSTDITEKILSKIRVKWIYIINIRKNTSPSLLRYSKLIRRNAKLLHALADKKKIKWEAIAILDGDAIPEEKYFYKLLKEIKLKKKLGITSGYLLDAKTNKKNYNRKNRPWGAATLYTKECLSDIGGFTHGFSHTTIEIILANKMKYETSQNSTTYFTHLRAVSEKYGFYKGYYQNGIAAKWLGMPLTFSIIKAIKLGVSKNPIKGIAFILGYLRWKGKMCQNETVKNTNKNKWKIWLRRNNI